MIGPDLNRIYPGDCLAVMATWPDNFVDTIITDPPYGLHFMGKSWDKFGGPIGVDHQTTRERSGSMHAGEYDENRNPEFQEWCKAWATEALRIAKPGAMMLVCGGTRTYHRMISGIEDAGWQIRDCLMWLYGSGFPKSLDISKAIDKAKGAEREVVGRRDRYRDGGERENQGNANNWGGTFGTNGVDSVTAPATDLSRQWSGWGTALKPAHEPIIVAQKPFGEIESVILKTVEELEKQLCTASSERTDTPRFSSMVNMCLSTVTSWRACLVEHFRRQSTSTTVTIVSPTIDLKTLNSYLLKITPASIIQAATQHGGYWFHALPAARYINAACLNISSTLELSAIESAIEQGHISHPDAIADSPAWEPIILAMKPLDGTFAENAEKWGVAGINVDGGRIGTEERINPAFGVDGWRKLEGRDDAYKPAETKVTGRWPANLILDEEAAAMLDGQSGITCHSGTNTGELGIYRTHDNPAIGLDKSRVGFGDRGGASRFFYVAKSGRAERNEGCEGLDQKTGGAYGEFAGDGRGRQTEHAPSANHHPTVKPLSLMKYLCQLTKTPSGGIVLDPFAGSGTTLWAAEFHNRPWLGIEMNTEYVAIAEARIARERSQIKMVL